MTWSTHYASSRSSSGTSIEAIWREEDSAGTPTRQRRIGSWLRLNLEIADDRGGHPANDSSRPCRLAGRRLGVVQGSNRVDGESHFVDDDARLLAIFATQAAAIIENARLYRDLEGRVSESRTSAPGGGTGRIDL